MQKLLVALAAIGFVSALAPTAHADSYTESVTINNPAGGGFACTPACTGPYATMQVNLTSATTATITVTALSDSNYQYLIGDDNENMAFHVNASTFTAGTFQAKQLSGFTSITYTGTDTGITGYDDSGLFNLAIYGSGSGFTTAADQISFVLTDTSGTWGSAADVLTNNGYSKVINFDAAIEAYACPVGACTSTSEQYHGVVDVQATPEPGSLALLGTGVLGLGGLVRRKFRR